MSKPRTMLILEEIINHYTSNQEALSARLLAKHSKLSLSPTTIRNLMDDLSQLGLLTTDGVSRGRVPTQKAYFIHLDKLKESPELPAKAGMPALVELKAKKLEQALEQVGQFLAEKSNVVALAFLPSRNDSPLDWVRLLAIGSNQVLVVTCTLFGELWSKLLTSTDQFPQSLLDEIQQYINDNYRKKSLAIIRQEVLSEKPQAVLVDMPSVGSALRLLRKAFEWEQDPRFYTWGQETIHDWPKFENFKQFYQLEQMLKNPKALLALLQQGHDVTHSASSQNKIKVAISGELSHLKNISIICTDIQSKQWQARLALLGPIWMDYQQMVALTHQTAQKFNQWLDKFW